MDVKPDAHRAVSWGSMPVAATVLTAIMALQMLLIAITNWTDFGTNQTFVHHVLEMDTTFRDKDVMWRRIDSDAIQDIAYVAIILWESVTALVLGWAVVRFAGSLRTGGGYDSARRTATIGFLMVILLFWGGFIVVGGEYFEMWQSKKANGLEPALQNTLLAGLALIVTHLPSPDWHATSD